MVVLAINIDVLTRFLQFPSLCGTTIYSKHDNGSVQHLFHLRKAHLPILFGHGRKDGDGGPESDESGQQKPSVESIRQKADQNTAGGENEDVNGTDENLILETRAEVIVDARRGRGRRRRRRGRRGTCCHLKKEK